MFKNQSERSLLLVSFFISNDEAMKKMCKIWNQRNISHSRVNESKESVELDHREFGGQIWLIDPANLKLGVLAQIDLPLAFGLEYSQQDKTLYCTSGNTIHAIKNGAVQLNVIECHLFNDLHAIRFNENGGLMVTSTGLDSILEIDPVTKELIWRWSAQEHGLSETGENEKIDINFDYRFIQKSTPEHCTHLNSVLDLNDGTVLATLFHQGQLIRIKRREMTFEVLLSGLKQPHSIRAIDSTRFSICDSCGDRVLVLDENFAPIQSISGDFSWVQDAIFLDDQKRWVVCDSNNNRIIVTDKNGVQINELKWSVDSRKVSTLLRVSSAEVKDIFGDKLKL